MFIRNVVKSVEYSLEKCRRLKYSMRTFQTKYIKDKEEQIKLKLTGSVKHIKQLTKTTIKSIKPYLLLSIAHSSTNIETLYIRIQNNWPYFPINTFPINCFFILSQPEHIQFQLLIRFHYCNKIVPAKKREGFTDTWSATTLVRGKF